MRHCEQTHNKYSFPTQMAPFVILQECLVRALTSQAFDRFLPIIRRCEGIKVASANEQVFVYPFAC